MTFVANVCDQFDLSTPLFVLDAFSALNWEEQLSEAGSGDFDYQNDATALEVGNLVQMVIDGTPAWVMCLEEFERIACDPAEGAALQTKWSGRGHLSVLERALVYPDPGIVFPEQVDMVFNWTHRYYDDSAWVAPDEVDSVQEAKELQSISTPNGWPIIPWADDMPANEGAQLGSVTKIIWAPGDGSMSTPMTVGTVYFRQAFTVPWDGTYAFFLTGDDNAFAAIDGCPVAGTEAGDSGGGFDSVTKVMVTLTAGDHVLAVSCRNWPAFPGILNLAGAAWALYVPGYPPELICQSVSSGVVCLDTFPAEPPGMSPGNAMRLWLEQARARGYRDDVVLSCDDDNDDNGDPWTEPFPTISTKIWTDGLTFSREISATYSDNRMDPAGFTLEMFNFGAMGDPGGGIDFLPLGDAVKCVQHGQFRPGNVMVGHFNGGTIEVTDFASVGVIGRYEVIIDVGAADTTFEATRVLTQALATYANAREQIQVIVDGPVPYVDYELGDAAGAEDSHGNQDLERITAIGVVVDDPTGRVHGTPTLKDLLI